MEIIDITGIPPNGKTYGGNTEKYGITYENADYIIKKAKDTGDM